jgi:hypothetical protein
MLRLREEDARDEKRHYRLCLLIARGGQATEEGFKQVRKIFDE